MGFAQYIRGYLVATSYTTYACRHRGEVSGRNRADANYQAKKAAQRICPECEATAWAAERAQENAHALEQTIKAGWAPIAAISDKQFSYATTVRWNALNGDSADNLQKLIARVARVWAGAVVESGAPADDASYRRQTLIEAAWAFLGDAPAHIDARWWLDTPLERRLVDRLCVTMENQALAMQGRGIIDDKGFEKLKSIARTSAVSFSKLGW